MEKAIEHLVHQFGGLRTGRANAAMVEGVEVEIYGAKQPLKAVAMINTPDARTISIQPWDKSTMGAIEKQLQQANLGMNPSNDGQVIRLTIPPMTAERRKDIVKDAHKLAEEARVALRNVRHHAIDETKKLEKEKKITEDELKTSGKEIQKLTDEFNKKVDEATAKKEKEIMEV